MKTESFSQIGRGNFCVIQGAARNGNSCTFIKCRIARSTAYSGSGHTLLMIDGVKVYDPMAPSADFDFANLTTDNIERIEIIRRPQSSLYGSDAIGGVINVITKKGEGKPKFTTSFEGRFSQYVS